MTQPSTFYKSFSEKKLTSYGSARRGKIEQHRLRLLHRHSPPGGEMFEIGPGHGTLAEHAVQAGWQYTAIEASPILVDVLKKKGLRVIESWTPPIPVPDASADVVYADQVLEHMSGIDAAREFTAEALRALRPGGVFFVVVPDYLKERTFFWDVDYTHNFVTTQRRVSQLFNDNGFDILQIERSIGVSTGFRRDALAAGAVLANLPGLNTLSRRTGTEDLLFKIRKNLFETLTFVARKPTA
ncbi:MAG: class I SAM-dependent methyltransferase [Acidobacteria bacterium]|nr:class I SAM-dependent methyltransferase [Acidobacteriota bacterium]